jgi:hypothetical protein
VHKYVTPNVEVVQMILRYPARKNGRQKSVAGRDRV